MSEPAAAPKKKRGKGVMVIAIVIILLAAGGGAAVPFVLKSKKSDDHAEAKPKPEPKQLTMAFGEVGAHLADPGPANSYIRLKILLVHDETDTKEITELMDKQKPFLKNWLIAYLSDLQKQDVKKTAGVNRIRREIRNQFNAMLYSDGSEKILEILFDEFVVQ